ncbi:MAG: M1 family aminopeptidase, partial [Jatrophihabitantaceae bacterium]
MSITRRSGPWAAAALALLLAACSQTVGGTPQPGRSVPDSTAPTTAASSGGPSSWSPSGPTATNPADASCPTSYRVPDPNRPKVQLAFTVASDLTSVTGTEHLTFTPDLPITELVFRLTANTAPTVAAGNKIVVRTATADHGAKGFSFTGAGAAASTQGGLLHIPFGAKIPAGTTVTADLSFTLTLGEKSFDRFGRTGDGASRYAWFGSGQPLLAWEHGFGWHEEDMLQFTAESATSEAMDTDLTVTAPATDTVIMSGDPSPVRSGATRTWHSAIAAARDVSVAVGPFAVSDTVVDGVKLRLGAYSATLRDQLVPEFKRSITDLSARFGPFPFPSLSVARLPASGGGIEYPSSILMLDGSRLVAVHETAHQWFYAMVGDSQALHPWLDEAFAQYSEQLVNGDTEPVGALAVPGAVDRSAESYGADMNDYYYITYDKGAAALHAARAAAGPAQWDAAVRCYVAANAWQIANPSDFK